MKYWSWPVLTAFLLSVSLLSTSSLATEGHTHKHSQMDVSTLLNTPSVSLKVKRDEMSGWNIQIEAENFRFAPDHVNQHPVANEGHAHLYVDGKKITRLYGSWFYLTDLSPGPHTLSVTLNANNHAELALHGKPVAASIEVVQ